MTETPSSPDNEPTAPRDETDVTADGMALNDEGLGGYPPVETLGEPPRGGAKRGVVIGVGAAVLAVIAAAGIYATTALSGGGRQPDDLAPKSTFAYAKLDLDPAANQKLAAREFFGKFPKLKKPGADGNVFDSLLEQMFEGEENFTYEADVKPWFDKRAAVAAFKGTDGKPAVVGILQSKDDSKAKAAMDKAVAKAKEEDGGGLAYRIDDGYVVIGETQAHVDDARAQSDKATIDDNATFAEDLDRLDGDQVVVGWVDVKQAFDTVKSEIPDAGLIPNAITDQLTGRVVTGLHMDGDYVEVSGFFLGQQGAAPPVAADAKLLKDLPATTLAALSVNGLSEGLKNGLSQLGALGMDPNEFIEPFLGELGLNLESDVLPLLGEQTVITLGGIPLGVEDLSAGLISTVKDPAGAKDAGSKLAAAITQMGVDVKTDVSGNTFYLATGEYLPTLKSTHGLGDVEKFQKAMGDLGSVTGAVYVDLEAILTEIGPEAKADAGALRSVGVTSGYDKGQPYFRFRVVAL